MLLLLDRIPTCRPSLRISPDAQITRRIQIATLFVVDSLTQMYGTSEFTVLWMVRSNIGSRYGWHRRPCRGRYLLTADEVRIGRLSYMYCSVLRSIMVSQHSFF